MPELTREEKLKLFEKLPQKLQDLMGSEDTGALLLYLGQKYNLTDDKVKLLSGITGNVILGILPLTSLVSEITSKIGADNQTAAGIVQDLSNELFVQAGLVSPAPVAPVPAAPAVTPAPRADQYREPTAPPAPPAAGPVINLRPAPPPPSLPSYQPPPAAPKPIPPLTFTRPVMPTQPEEMDTYREPIEISPAPIPLRPVVPAPPQEREEPRQFILRSPGMPPSEPPILDLRQDKGEF